MALTSDQKEELTVLADNRLDEAESIWCQFGRILSEEVRADALTKTAETAPSGIPGHRTVSDHDPQVDTFIALVADMRDSSKHLLCAISQKKAAVSELQRLHYETSALLPVLAQTIRFGGGSVTEYLGDGILALFQVDAANPDLARKAAYRVANNCVNDSREIVNTVLRKRYNLPSLDIGVGLSQGRAVVTLIGLHSDKHPKAIGRCVYVATKLSCGQNQVIVDEWLHSAWTTSTDGRLTFTQKRIGDLLGYAISRSTD